MGQNPIDERRRYFRLEYPSAERLTVRYKGGDYRVSQVSEGGVKILLDRHCVVRVGQFFAGVIRFKDAGIVPIVGVVLRFDEREMVVKLTIGISFNRMMAEQRRIRQKYPMFFEKD
jgi:hypothetical protein